MMKQSKQIKKTNNNNASDNSLNYRKLNNSRNYEEKWQKKSEPKFA